MRSFAFLGIGVFIFFVSAAFVSAQSPLSRLVVTVEDPTGAPIPDAAVQVQHWVNKSGQKPQLIQDGLLTTDAGGRAVFEVPEYSYEIVASAQGFVPAVGSVDVYGGLEFGRDFKLTIRTGGGVRVESRPKSQ